MPARSAVIVIARRQRSILHRSTLQSLAAESMLARCWEHVFATVSHDASLCVTRYKLLYMLQAGYRGEEETIVVQAWCCLHCIPWCTARVA